MTPKKEARQLIGELLEMTGWQVKLYKQSNLSTDIASDLLHATKKRVNSVAKCILSKKFPRLSRRNEDVCGICEFNEECWSK